MSSCATQVFSNVTPAQFDCLSQKASAAGINISGNTASVTPSDYTPTPMSGSPRPPNSESMTTWHPLSQQELAEKAMQLAQQFAAARASHSPATGMTAEDLIGSAPVSVRKNRSTAARSRPDLASDLRVTPEP